jgi:hypothetical protein
MGRIQRTHEGEQEDLREVLLKHRRGVRRGSPQSQCLFPEVKATRRHEAKD